MGSLDQGRHSSPTLYVVRHSNYNYHTLYNLNYYIYTYWVLYITTWRLCSAPLCVIEFTMFTMCDITCSVLAEIKWEIVDLKTGMEYPIIFQLQPCSFRVVCTCELMFTRIYP